METEEEIKVTLPLPQSNEGMRAVTAMALGWTLCGKPHEGAWPVWGYPPGSDQKTMIPEWERDMTIFEKNVMPSMPVTAILLNSRGVWQLVSDDCSVSCKSLSWALCSIFVRYKFKL